MENYKKILTKVLEREVQKLITEDYIVVTSDDLIEWLEEDCDLTAEETKTALEIIDNSWLYNSVESSNGKTYYFDTLTSNVKDYMKEYLDFKEDDKAWDSYITVAGKSYKFRDVYQTLIIDDEEFM